MDREPAREQPELRGDGRRGDVRTALGAADAHGEGAAGGRPGDDAHAAEAAGGDVVEAVARLPVDEADGPGVIRGQRVPRVPDRAQVADGGGAREALLDRRRPAA